MAGCGVPLTRSSNWNRNGTELEPERNAVNSQLRCRFRFNFTLLIETGTGTGTGGLG